MKQPKPLTQETRIERTKRKILDAAKEVFLVNGFKEATVTLIAKKADIGYGTVYSHFPSGKDEVLLHIMEEVMNDFYAITTREYSPNSKEEGYNTTFKNAIDFLSLAIKYRKQLVVFHEAIGLSSLIRTEWEKIIERLIDRVAKNVMTVNEKGLMRDENYDPKIVAGSLIYPAEKFLWKLALEKTDQDYKDIAENLVGIYINGLFK